MCFMMFHDFSLIHVLHYVVVSKRIRQIRHRHKWPQSSKHEVTTTLTLNDGVKSFARGAILIAHLPMIQQWQSCLGMTNQFVCTMCFLNTKLHLTTILIKFLNSVAFHKHEKKCSHMNIISTKCWMDTT